MSKYIFRLEKMPKNLVQSRIQHALREIYCPDADPARAHLNIRQGPGTYKEFREKLNASLQGLRIFREDSPPVLEFFISASPDFFKNGGNEKKLFDDSYAKLVNMFGAENVLLLTIHRDETSPHLSAFVVPKAVNPEIAEYEAQISGTPLPPLPEGKKRRRKKPFDERPPEFCLSAKAYIDGPRSLSRLQTEFWEAAGKGVGLERGIEGSKARHVNVNDWKKAMARLQDMKVPEFVVPEMKPTDKLVPGKWAREVKAAFEKQVSEVMKEIQLIMANAKLKDQNIEDITKRLNFWEKSLAARSVALDAEVMERVEKVASVTLSSVKSDLAELEHRRAADAPLALPAPDPVAAQLNGALSDRAMLMRALAKMIKQTYQADQLAALADEMGVPAGRGDIFDRLVKSGKAPNFEAAVMQVAAHIDLETGSGTNADGVASEPEMRL